ncbi:hypothetical protein [Streptomyces monashensis]|nr:hypothetical protein [Streptomyces monashensis]
MIVVALLVPVMAMLVVFALDAYEDLLFPPTTKPGPDQETLDPTRDSGH